jgi:hypothetical protein
MFFLLSCTSTKKIAEHINTRTNESLSISAEGSRNLNLKWTAGTDSLNHFERTKNSFVPAILFWGWNGIVEFNLNDDYLENRFKLSLQPKLDSLFEAKKMVDYRLELEVSRFPGQYAYSNKGTVLIFVIAYTTNIQEFVMPLDNELMLSYSLLKGAKRQFTGTVETKAALPAIGNGFWSTRRLFDEYFLQLEAYTDYLSEQIVLAISDGVNMDQQEEE